MKIKQKTIQNSDHMALYDMMVFIEQCIKEGYRVPDKKTMETFPRRYGSGSYFVAMVLEDDEKQISYVPHEPNKKRVYVAKEGEPTKEELLEMVVVLQKRDELFALAKKYSLDVDMSLKLPLQIKKALREAIGSPDTPNTTEEEEENAQDIS